VFEEARRCGAPATVVASIVDVSDEQLIQSLWQPFEGTPNVKLRIVRIAGTGKRDGLAHGFRAIAETRERPHAVQLQGVSGNALSSFRAVPKVPS